MRRPQAPGGAALPRPELPVIAAGDSYNDTTMLLEADAGFLFHAPDNVKAEFPQLPALDEYDDLLDAITAELT
jgi:phosphoserine/homoserine phosphotransferase